MVESVFVEASKSSSKTFSSRIDREQIRYTRRGTFSRCNSYDFTKERERRESTAVWKANSFSGRVWSALKLLIFQWYRPAIFAAAIGSIDAFEIFEIFQVCVCKVGYRVLLSSRVFLTKWKWLQEKKKNKISELQFFSCVILLHRDQ